MIPFRKEHPQEPEQKLRTALHDKRLFLINAV